MVKYRESSVLMFPLLGLISEGLFMIKGGGNITILDLTNYNDRNETSEMGTETVIEMGMYSTLPPQKKEDGLQERDNTHGYVPPIRPI